MPGKSVTVQLSEEQVKALTQALGPATDAELSDADLETLLSIAVASWSDTLFGGSRYRTITELYVSWLRDVYAKHLTEEEPTERRLFTRLGLPYGQAAYVARVLREGQPIMSRKRAVTNLDNALTSCLPKARQWVKDRRGDERMNLTISKAARRELDAILSALVESGEEVNPLRGAGTMGDYVTILVVAGDIERLAEKVSDLDQQLQNAGG